MLALEFLDSVVHVVDFFVGMNTGNSIISMSDMAMLDKRIANVIDSFFELNIKFQLVAVIM